MSSTNCHETTEGPIEGALHVDRAITELRRGRFVEILDSNQTHVVAAVDTVDQSALRRLLDSGQHSSLIISGQRALALGESAKAAAWQIPVEAGLGPDTLRELAGLAWEQDIHAGRSVARARNAPEAPHTLPMSPCHAPALTAGLELARLANLAPALIATERTAWFDNAALLTVEAASIGNWSGSRDASLMRVSDARVPLLESEHTRFILYRERFGGDEHVAIVVGRPDTAAPVMVRLHSACLTGDLFASLRCDCGEQLRSSVEQLGQSGGGVILYLAQEGRGIGLANKLRAYQLQDQGLDTIDADRYLGFRNDERNYAIACSMLHELGVRQVRLMTNNPVKIAALRAGGITVVDRSPLNTEMNPHNARYIRTKQDRAGHFTGSNDADATDAAD